MDQHYAPGGTMVMSAATGGNAFASPVPKRTRQPRNSACVSCAKLKMKCIPGPEPSKCERCHRMDRECTAATPKPRKTQEERTGDTNRPQSSTSAAPVQDSVPFVPSEPRPVKPALKRKADALQTGLHAESMLASSDLRHKSSRSFTALLAQRLQLDPKHESLLKGIDTHSVQNSFIIFRQYAPHFPFINPNQSDDSVQCVIHRPLLTVAICAVASGSNPELQLRISNAIRLSISERAILSNEQSIDLLLGLMVYLAWNHHYLDKPQVSQYLSLLAGMAADCGIHRTISEDISPQDQATVVERERAFVGCYYLCSMLSRTGFNNPTPLRWSESVRRCAVNVGRICPLPSDKDLYSLIELSLAMEDFLDLYHRPPNANDPYSQFKDLQAKATQSRLRSLRRGFPRLASEPACTAAMINVHQKAMAESEIYDTASLIQCACTIKEYIDDLLSKPPSVFHQMSILDWTDLLNIVILMARISKPPPNSGSWEAGALTSMLPPEEIMDALAVRMASVSGDDPLVPRHEGLVQWFTAFCETVKQQIIRDPSGGQSTRGGTDAMPPLPYPPNTSAKLMDTLRNGVLNPAFLNQIQRTG